MSKERILGINQVLENGDVIVAVDSKRLEKPIVVDTWHQGPDLIRIYDLSGESYTYRKYSSFTIQPMHW